MLVDFYIAMVEYSDKGILRGKGLILADECDSVLVHCVRGDLIAGGQGSCARCIHSQELEDNECYKSAFSTIQSGI